MPRKSTNSTRCVYSERGRRCRRAGVGDPPVCAPHKIAFAEAAQNVGRRPGDALSELFESFMSGRKITKKKVGSALKDLGDILNGMPTGPGIPRAHTVHRPPQSPPPRDPDLEARLEFQRAKVVLGFAESEPITADMVKERRKVLARKHHPDRGGDPAKMTAINAACDVLLRSAA